MEKALPAEALVVSASRKEQKLTEAPATITVVTARDLLKSSGFTYAEQLGRLKGVDTYRSGIDNISINTRGFMAAFNYRTQLIADGRNATLVGGGIGLTNILPVARNDIERIEMVLGPSSALYGPNAHNGLVNIITKHPRDSQGTIVTLGGGNRSTRIIRFRHAQVLGDRVAFKVNVELLFADDFVKNDTAAVQLDDNNQVVKVIFEDADSNVENLRLDASLYISVAEETEAVFSTGHSKTKSIQTSGVGRLQFDNFNYRFYQARLNSPHLFLQGSLTENNGGDTYLLETRVSFESRGFSREEAIKAARFINKSKRYNLEAQGNLDWQGFHLIGGINYEDNRPVSEGTYLPDTSGNRISISQTGIYGQMDRDFGAALKIVLAGRYDTHDNYDSQFSPRAALVYRLSDQGAFRFTYNRAFQAPAITQQELLTFAGFAGPFPVMIRGNARGFTLADGTKIRSLQVERNETFEVGYKSSLNNRFSLDVNAYHSVYKNFVSPLTVIGDLSAGNPVARVGDIALTPEVTFTYLNFGKVTITGLDLALNFRPTQNLELWFNYSHINPEDIRNNLENDLNGDGRVSEGEAEALSFNTPQNKYNIGIAVSDFLTNGTSASLSIRHLDIFDFISGQHRATMAGKGTGMFQFKDRGPLGGFEAVDLQFAYTRANGWRFNLSISNVFDAHLRQMVGSPAIGRLIMGELSFAFNPVR